MKTLNVKASEAVVVAVKDDAPTVSNVTAAVSVGTEGEKVPRSAEFLPRLVQLLLKPVPPGGFPLTSRQIAVNTGYSKTKVQRIRSLLPTSEAKRADLLALGARELYKLFNRPPGRRRELPDFDAIGHRLQQPGMTRYRLWREYRQTVSAARALGYVQFTRLLKRHLGAQKKAMRQKHLPGYVYFLDFSGKRPYYFDRKTGRKISPEMFVASAGASARTFALCVASQSVDDWLEASTRMLEFFGGVPQVLMCDNLKAGVTKPGAAPTMQRDYLQFAAHYDVAVLAARPAHPDDKAVVELEIQHIQRWLLPELAKQRFYSLGQLNEEIARLMVEYNRKPFSVRPGSRESQFLALEKPLLQPLPRQRYVHYVRSSRRKVPADYHVFADGHHYSVPHRYVGCEAEARLSKDRVQIWIESECVAEHARGEEGASTTDPAHQTEEHRAQALRTPEELLRWGEQVGPNMGEVMRAQFRRFKVPLQGLQPACALQNLGKKATFAELEAAAKEALALGTVMPSDLKRLLQAGLGMPPTPASVDPFASPAPVRAVQPLAVPRQGRRRSAQGRPVTSSKKAVQP